MIFLIACSLALDAFAVALSCGVSQPRFRLRDALKLGVVFGLFQCLMPLIGFVLGAQLSLYIQRFDHWVAFALLSVIGSKMLVDSLFFQENLTKTCPFSLSPRRLISLAVATSIDALAVGVSMAFVPTVAVLPACALIGVVAFCFTLAGGLLGRRLGNLFQRRATLLGGLVLLTIGVKLLVEHL